MMCERKECAEECLYRTPVMEVLLAPVTAQLSRPQVSGLASKYSRKDKRRSFNSLSSSSFRKTSALAALVCVIIKVAFLSFLI